MIQTKLVGLLAIMVCCLATQVTAQTATVGISTDSVLVGERFFMTITVRAGTGQTVLFPPLSDGPLSVGDTEFLRRVDTAGEPAAVDSATYEVAVFGIDSALVGGLPIAVIQAEGDTLFFESPAREVGIRSIVPEGAEGMKDLAPLAAFPMSIWPWVIGTILALIAAWYLYGYLRARANRPADSGPEEIPTISPYEEAVTRLSQISQVDPREEEDVQAYHDELSDILRTYLEKALGLPALERTTGELTFSLRQLSSVGSDYIPESIPDRIAEALSLSDLVKFATYVSISEENQRALGLIRDSIEDLETGRRRRQSVMEAESV